MEQLLMYGDINKIYVIGTHIYCKRTELKLRKVGTYYIIVASRYIEI